MPAQGVLRGPKAKKNGEVPQPRHGGGDWDSHSSDVTVQKEDEWKAPSAEELQERRARQWALATQHDTRAQAILMHSVCAVCHEKVARNFTTKGDLLIITSWMHGFAANHPVALAEDKTR